VKLGDLLVSDGILTPQQVESALRAQVMWGGRLGTNLVELGFVDLDALSRALGRQHKLPAALARHFERGDRELQRLLSADVAEKFACVPLLRVGESGEDVVVAVVDPLATKPNAIVADEIGVAPDRIIQSVAAELRIRYHLERVYAIPRDVRFLRSRGPSVPAYPQFTEAPPADEDPSAPDVAIPIIVTDENGLTMPVSIATATVVSTPPSADPAPPPRRAQTAPVVAPASISPAESLDDLTAYIVTDDDASAAPAPIVDDEPSGRDRRQYVRTLADMVDPGVPTGLEHKTLGRIAIRRVAVNAEPNAASTFPEVTRAIRRATDRERIAELVMAAIDRFAPTCEAAMLLTVRGEVAIGWKGFVRDKEPPPEFAVPLDRPGLVVVARKNTTARCSAADLGQIDELLLEALGHDSGDLVVVPVAVAGQVVCMIATATAADAPVAAVEAVAAAAGAAFARLMQAAGR
jgi:hypothetical protein